MSEMINSQTTDRTLESNIAFKRLVDILVHGSVSDLNIARGMIETRLASLILGEPRTRVDVPSGE